jgi:hypothetical protein
VNHEVQGNPGVPSFFPTFFGGGELGDMVIADLAILMV